MVAVAIVSFPASGMPGCWRVISSPKFPELAAKSLPPDLFPLTFLRSYFMLTARDIMSKEIHTVTPEMSVDDLARAFVEKKVSTLPVVDADGKLIGIISATDLVEQDKPLHIPTVVAIFDMVIYLESEKNFRDEVEKITARTVGEICAREVVTCPPEMEVAAIAALMTEKKVHLLPVVEEGKLVGVVGRHDILRSMNL
jgi:CBS domain-containing protein